MNMILQSAGISVFDENGGISLVDNEGLKEAMRVYLKLIDTKILQEQTDWSDIRVLSTMVLLSGQSTVHGFVRQS